MRSFINGLLTGGIIGLIFALLYFTPDIESQSNVNLGKVRKLQRKAKRVAKDIF